MAQIELVEITKRYRDVLAVEAVNLSIPDKEFLVLLGPSGCGKSTLLRMIAGLEPISSGELYIDGELVNYKPLKERNVAMVFQNYALYPHMEVQDNISFALKLAREPRESIASRVLATAASLGLEPLLRRLPAQLSGGQRQRVALGRAIIRKPSVFLMDEPLSNLDALLRVQTRGELIKLHERLETTVVYVTHDQVEAMTMGQRIVVMRDGVIQQVGPPQDVYDRPVNIFVAGFLGSPSINFMQGRIAPGDGGLRFESPSLRLPLAPALQAPLELAGLGGRPATLGIRPEDLSVAPPGDPCDLGGSVHFIEPVGSDKYVSVRYGDEECLVRTAPHTPLEKGQPIGLRLNWERLHIFDEAGRSVLGGHPR